MNQLPKKASASIFSQLDLRSRNALANTSNGDLAAIKYYREHAGFLALLPGSVRSKIFEHLSLNDCQNASGVNSSWNAELEQYLNQEPLLKAAQLDMANALTELDKILLEAEMIVRTSQSAASVQLAFKALHAECASVEALLSAHQTLAESGLVDSTETQHSFIRIFNNGLTRRKVDCLSLEGQWYFIRCWDQRTPPTKDTVQKQIAVDLEYSIRLFDKAMQLAQSAKRYINIDVIYEIWLYLGTACFMRSANAADRQNAQELVKKSLITMFAMYDWHMKCQQAGKELPTEYHEYFGKLSLDRGVSVLGVFLKDTVGRSVITVRQCEALYKKTSEYLADLQQQFLAPKPPKLKVLERQAKEVVQQVLKLLAIRAEKVNCLVQMYDCSAQVSADKNFRFVFPGQQEYSFKQHQVELKHHQELLTSMQDELGSVISKFSETCRSLRELTGSNASTSKTGKKKKTPGAVKKVSATLEDSFYQHVEPPEKTLTILLESNALLADALVFPINKALYHADADAKRFWLHKMLDKVQVHSVAHSVRCTPHGRLHNRKIPKTLESAREKHLLSAYDDIIKHLASGQCDLIMITTMFNKCGDYDMQGTPNHLSAASHYMLALDCLDRHMHLHPEDTQVTFDRSRIKAKLDDSLPLNTTTHTGKLLGGNGVTCK